MTVHVVLGEFQEPRALLDAVRTLRGEHVRELDTHTPYPVHGLEDALGLPRSTIGWWTLFGGLAGALTAYGMQLYFNWWEFPLNIGNRPPHSPPVYVPVTFELMVLFAALTIVGSLIGWFWGFPRPHHPVFEHEPFVKTASASAFWVSVTTRIGEDAEKAKGRLEALGAKNVAIIQEPEEQA
jgi:hypothetical protein